MRPLVPIALAGLCMFAVQPLSAQGISVGVKGGAAFATLGGDEVTGAETKTGLSIGGSLGIGVTPTFSIQPEVIFSEKGATTTGEDAVGDLNLSYLEVPVLAKLSLPTPGGVDPYLVAGPAISFEVGCSISGEAEGVSIEVDCAEADVLETKSVDFGLVGGAGLGFMLGTGEATVDVRYDLGLSSISDAETVADMKNRAFTVMVGYSIGLGM